MAKIKTIYFLLFLMAIILMSVSELNEITVAIEKSVEKYTVVIDPGHGGVDGGAVSDDGTSEKDINLAICKYLQEELEKNNIDVVMTRDRDESLCSDNESNTIRMQKTLDLSKRKKIIDGSDADLAVSVHLNSFTQDRSVRGAQVFYPATGSRFVNESSYSAAKIIQLNLNDNINGGLMRTELEKNDVFLLKDPKVPTVIVECGFLSNREDADMLKRKKQQKKIAKIINVSICNFLRKCDEKCKFQG